MKKIEFQTKEKLIRNLTLDGRTDLIGRADILGVDLESYIESTCLIKDTFWIEIDFVKDQKEVVKYDKRK